MRKRAFLSLIAFSFVGMLRAQTTAEWFQKGRKTADPEEQIEFFTRAIAANADPEWEGLYKAYSCRGNAKCHLRRYDVAIADFDKAIQFDPDNAYAYNNRGNTKNELARYADAIPDFDKSLELKHDQPHYVYNNRGYTHFQLGHYAQAVADWEAMERTAPADYKPEWDYIAEAREKARK